MKKACTLFFQHDCRGAVLEAVRANTQRAVSNGSASDDWTELRATGVDFTLRLTIKLHERGGDQFSSIIQGLANYIRNGELPNKDAVEDWVYGVHLMMGVVFEDGHLDLASAHALLRQALQAGDGRLFDGFALLEAEQLRLQRS
jgi:hypothetical protein